jgi:hypothetical protein
VSSASIIIGLPLIAAAWFAGPQSWATAARRRLAPQFNARPALVFWITAGLLALVFIWGPIPAARNPLTMLLFTVLAFFGAFILRRQIAEEFPDVDTMVTEPTAT